MWGLLVRFGLWLLSGMIARVLIGAGLAIGTNIAIGKYVNYFLDRAIGYIANLPMQGILGLAGIDEALSILISSVMVRVYLAVITSSIRVVSG